MLTFPTMQRISARMKETFVTPESRAVFGTASTADKMTALAAACAARDKTGALDLGTNVTEILSAYLVCFAIKSGSVKPNSPEHRALTAELGVKVATQWHKALPPQTLMDFHLPQRQPSWEDEFARMNVVAETIDFVSASNTDAIAAAILTDYNLGGMETLMDDRGIRPTDVTLMLLVEIVRSFLPYKRPLWYANGALLPALPPGVDGESLAFRAAEAEAAIKAKREADAKALVAKRRETQRLELIQRRTAAFELLKAYNGPAAAGLAQLCAAAVTFQQWKEALDAAGDGRWLPDTLEDAVSVVRAMLGAAPLPTAAGVSEEAAAAKMKKWQEEEGRKDLEALNHVHQYILKAHSDRNPTWMTELADGSLQLRPQPKVVKVTKTRAARACEATLNRLWIKYGIIEVLRAVNSVVGAETVDIKPPSSYPPPPTVVVTEEEEDKDKVGTEAPVETPPPPPAE